MPKHSNKTKKQLIYEIEALEKKNKELELSLKKTRPISLQKVAHQKKNITNKAFPGEITSIEAYSTEHVFRQLVSNLPDMVIVHEQGKITYINNVMYELMGYKEEEVYGKSIFNFVHEEDKQTLKEVIKNRNKGINPPGYYHLRIATKAGNYRNFEIRASVLEYGEKMAVMAILTDITGKIQAENSLKELQQKFSAFMEKIPAKTFIKDHTGKFIYINSQWPELHQSRQKDWIGKRIDEIYDNQTTTLRIKTDQEALKKGKAINEETIFDDKNNKRYFQTVKFKIARENNQPLIGGVSFETTEIRNKEIQLRKQKIYFQQLFENIPEAIVILDNKDRIIDINPEFTRLFQYTLNEIKNKKINDIIVPSAMSIEASKFSKMALKGFLKVETRRRKKNGSLVDVSILGTSIIIDQKLNGVFGIYRDISDIKAHEKKIIIQNEELEAANEELSSINDELTESRNKLIEVNEKLELTEYTVNTASDSIYWIGKDAKFVFVNHAACKLLQYSKEEISGLTVYDIDKNINKYKFKKFWERLKRKKILKLESIQTKKDGSEVPVELSANFVSYRNEDYCISFARDISERKHAEKLLKESELRFRNMAANIQDGITIIEDGKLVYFNDKLKKIIGVNNDEDVYHYKLADFIANSDKHVKRVLKKALQNKINFFSLELWVNTKDNKRKYIQTKYTTKNIHGKKYRFVVTTDLTERKRYEELLKQERNMLDNVIAKNPYSIAIIDKNGQIIKTNQSLRDLFGNDPPEDYNLFTDSILKKNGFVDAIKDIKNKEKIVIPDLYYNPRELSEFGKNKKLCLRTVVFPIIGNNNQLQSIVLMHQDVTSLKKAQIELKESEELFRSLVSTTSSGILIYQGLKLKYINRAAELITGYTKDEIFNMDFLEIVHPDNWNLLEEQSLEVLNDENRLFGYEIKIITKDHKERWIDIRGNNIIYKGKKGGMFTFFDVTNRKLAEKKAQEASKLVEQERNMFIAGPVVVIKWNNDSEWSVEYVSPNVINLLEYTVDDFIKGNISFKKLIYKQDIKRVLDEVNEKISNNITRFEIEPYRLVSRFGNVIWNSSYISCIRDENNKKQFLGYIVDITDRKLAEEMVLMKNKELENFIYVTSHDIRSPLVNIQGFSKEIEHAVNDLENIVATKNSVDEIRNRVDFYFKQDIPDSLNYIFSSTEKMESLLSGLLKLSRMGRIELKFEDIDMQKLIDKIIATHEFKIKEKNVEIEVEKLPSCKGDKSMMNQVVSNLLDNALKYLKPKEKGKIKIGGYKKGNKSVYFIEDNGIGIKPEQKTKIFEIFQRFHNEIEGEGIGLTIIRKIVERHKGELWLHSEYGSGSKFFFSINNTKLYQNNY